MVLGGPSIWQDKKLTKNWRAYKTLHKVNKLIWRDLYLKAGKGDPQAMMTKEEIPGNMR